MLKTVKLLDVPRNAPSVSKTKIFLKKVSCPISSPRQKLSITKDSRKKYPIIKEESCHNFLSARSCFCSSVSDGSYLMVWMTLRLLCMPAQIIKMMVFAQIMDIWRPGRSMEDHLKELFIFQLDILSWRNQMSLFSDLYVHTRKTQHRLWKNTGLQSVY